MSFKMKYAIKKQYLTVDTKRRSGDKMPGVKFMVAHDTGNPGSTSKGNIGYYENTNNEKSASAHIFVDDKEIIECIPFLTGTPEKAWHVRYDPNVDDELYNAESNDYAGGVELCFGKDINNAEAYKRYIWVLAYACYKFKLNPARAIVGHEILDPGRKIDPSNGLKQMGRTYAQLLRDVVAEYNDCTAKDAPVVAKPKVDTVSTTYKVESGDTLWGIANKFGTDVVKLQELNPSINPNELQVGEKVVVKAGTKVQPKAEPVKVAAKPARPYPGKTLKLGDRGRNVEALQRALGFKGGAVDGVFGLNTERHVRLFQSSHKLVSDGQVGPATWNVLF